MISEKDLEELQKIPLDERVKRVEALLETKENPRGFELGLLLALKMGQEIREKKPLGSESGDLVVSWKDRYSEYVIEEAIASAKEFLLHPASIAEKIKAGMKKFEEKEKSPDVDALDPSGLRHDVAGQDSAGQQNSAESKDQNETTPASMRLLLCAMPVTKRCWSTATPKRFPPTTTPAINSTLNR